MRVHETRLPGVLRIERRVFGDARGWFVEAWNAERYRDAGIAEAFVQDNVSYSTNGILRGLHLQHDPHAQGKLVSVVRGEVFDVAVDVRPASSTFGQWVGVTLSAENGRQLYIPPGFAHGFVVTGDDALVTYKVTAAYAPASEVCIRWDDPEIGIDWPIVSPTVSDRDAAAGSLQEWLASSI
ncbi:MAG: dTDP-4-dehydrorhamnose 3,5-epimerase [Bacteroidota bacterium]